MEIEKNKLKKVELNNVEKDLINLLNKWCMDDYTMFGGILDLIENIGVRIILLNYNKNDKSFLTFDKHARPLQIKLIIDKNNRKIIINKYDDIHEYLYNKNKDYIYIHEVEKNKVKEEKQKRRIRKI